MADNTNPFSLHNKTILITGASSGIGRQCAVTCSQMGAKIIALGRNEERLQETITQTSDPDTHTYYSIDLVNYQEVEGKIKEIIAQHGNIDGMVNNAGISATLPFKLTSPSKMEPYMQTNVIAGLNLVRLLYKKKYLNAKGSIILMASVMGMVGEAGKTLYGMTKGALIAAAKSMAVEFAPREVRVNSISPGVVETPLSQNSYYSKDEKLLEQVKSQHPLGLGKPEDVANTCVYLLSDASRWVTGTNLTIDGGYTAR